MTRQFFTRRLLSAIGPVLGLLFVVALFASDNETREFFLSGSNFKKILTQTVIVAIGALGMTLIIITGGIDLSVGSVVALSSVTAAVLLMQGVSPLAAALGAILTGGLVGVVNGALIAWLRMMPFIVTLGMMGVARGVAKSKWLADNQTVNSPETPLNHLMLMQKPDEFFPLPVGVWMTVALALGMTIVLRSSIFGRRLFAIGSNEAAARLCGVQVRLYKQLLYPLAGLFFGLAGVLQMSRLTQGDPTIAIGLELDIIAAVVIGGASLNGGSGSIAGSMIGALIMAVLRNGANLMGWANYVQEIIIGVVIVVAVALDRFRTGHASEEK